MSYRPITDFWLLARCKYKDGSKRYGGYLGGFPERARVLIGCPIDRPMLHVCGGLAKQYPHSRGFGERDKTMDLDESVHPDLLMDCRNPFWPTTDCIAVDELNNFLETGEKWGGILIDPPYSEPDAEKYPPGASKYPSPNELVRTAMNTLQVGKRVGIIHYILPQCPNNAKFVACVGIVCGFNNRIRVFSVFERIS